MIETDIGKQKTIEFGQNDAFVRRCYKLYYKLHLIGVNNRRKIEIIFHESEWKRVKDRKRCSITSDPIFV